MIPANWCVKKGMFDVPKGTKDIDLISRAEKAVAKFVKHFERLGYKLVARPKVTLLTVSDRSNFIARRDNRGGTLLVPAPAPNTIRPDHPFAVPDRDQYVVQAWFEQTPRQVRVELSDGVVRRLHLEKHVV